MLEKPPVCRTTELAPSAPTTKSAAQTETVDASGPDCTDKAAFGLASISVAEDGLHLTTRFHGLQQHAVQLGTADGEFVVEPPAEIFGIAAVISAVPRGLQIVTWSIRDPSRCSTDSRPSLSSTAKPFGCNAIAAPTSPG